MRITGLIDTSVPGQLRLCPGRTNRRPGPPPGVVTEGLDPTVHDGGVTTAVGVLRGPMGEEVLAVEQQSLPQWPRHPGRPTVPCPEPPGGWAEGGAPYDDRSPDDGVLNDFHARHQAMVGRVRLVRPSDDRQVAVVVVADERERDVVARELGEHFAGRLCVVDAVDDVDLARRAQEDPRFRLGTMTAGVGMDDAARQVAHFRVWRITDAMVEALADYPPGLVTLQPFIEAVS